MNPGTREFIRKYQEPILIVLFTLFAILPLLNNKFFSAHDSEHHLIRLIELDRSIKDGEYYPRWLPDLAYGYGYPLFNYYPPLVYYLAEVLHLAGLDFSESLKGIYILGFIGSGLTIYLLAREFFDKNASLVAAVAYVYAPYHFLDAYVRGALPEFFSFIFLPIIFWSLYKLVETENTKYIAFTSLSYCLLILTHNIMSLIFTPLFLAYSTFLFITSKKYSALKPTFLALLLALGLSAFYWMPALFERQFVHSENVFLFDYRDHFVYPLQLLALDWGFGLSIPGPNDGMSFQIGPLYIYAIVASFAVIKFGYAKKQTLFFQFIALLSIFFALEISHRLWGIIPLMAFIQFPWRFLGLTAFAASFLFGAFSSLFRKNTLFYLLIILTILTSLNHIDVNYTDRAPPTLEEIRLSGTTGTITNEFLPAQVKKMPSEPPLTPVSGNADIKIVELRTTRYLLEIDAHKEAKLRINTFWFPGWKAYLNGKEVETTHDNEFGVMDLEVPTGSHRLLVVFENTAPRKISAAISWLSLTAILYVVLARE